MVAVVVVMVVMVMVTMAATPHTRHVHEWLPLEILKTRGYDIDTILGNAEESVCPIYGWFLYRIAVPQPSTRLSCKKEKRWVGWWWRWWW